MIERLLSDGTGIICAGGGGIPVVRDDDGSLHGVEAVVDKDRTAALLASLLDADALLLLTDVSAVELGYGTPSARAIRHTSVEELRSHPFPDGSMGPKVDASVQLRGIVRPYGGNWATRRRRGALDGHHGHHHRAL